MIPKTKRFACFAAWLSGACLATVAQASVLTWDGNPGAAGNQDAAGTWNTSVSRWNGSTGTLWNNAPPDSAVFGANSGAAGLVTLGAAVAVDGITFNAPGSGHYTIAGDAGGLYRLSFGTTATSLTMNAAADITAPVAVVANATLTKTGSFTLTLAPSANSAFGTVNNSSTGIVALAGSATNTLADLKCSSGGTVQINGGSWTATNLTPAGGSNVVVNGGTLYCPGGPNLSANVTLNNGAWIVPSGIRFAFYSDGQTLAVTGGQLTVSNTTYSFRFGNFNSASQGGNTNTTGIQSGGSLVLQSMDIGGTGNGTSAKTTSYSLTGGSLLSNADLSIGADTAGLCTTTVALGGSGKLFVLGTLRGSQATGAKQVLAFTGGTLIARTVDARNLRPTPAKTAGALTNDGGTLAPGDVGTAGLMSITGDFTQNSGTLAIDLGGPTPATGFQSATGAFDALAVSGTATLGGTLAVTISPDYIPLYGESYAILGANNIAGAFANVAFGARLATTGGEGTFLVTHDSKNIFLSQFTPAVWPSAPLVNVTPASVTTAQGGSTTFTANVTSATAVRYQWRFNSQPILGETGSTLLVYNQPQNFGTYDVIVSNPGGTILSNSATLGLTAAWGNPAALIYHLDETPVAGAGAITDATGHTAGTLVNTSPLPVTQPSTAGTGWDFAGTSTYLKVPSNPTIQSLGDYRQTSGLTLSFWVKIPSAVNNARVGSLSGLLDVVESSTGALTCRFGGDLYYSPLFEFITAPLADNTWHQLVFTSDFRNRSGAYYLDGVKVSNASVNTSMVSSLTPNPTASLNIGADANGGNRLVAGLDEFAVYTKVLSASEVTQIYQRTGINTNTGTSDYSALLNPAPTVNVGPSGIIVWPDGASSVAAPLTAVASDFGGAVTYAWTKTSAPSGATVTFGSTTAASTTATLSAVGTYVLRCTVKDAGNITDYDEITLTVAANTAPTLGAVQASETLLHATASHTVDLSAVVLDDGLPNPPDFLTTQWTQVSGPAPVKFLTPWMPNTPVTIPATAGVYVLRVSVSDGSLSTHEDVTINVQANLPPVVAADAQPHTLVWPAKATTLSGTATDDGALSYAWTQVSGPATATIANPTALSTGVTFPARGQYVFQLAASDGSLTGTATTWVNIWQPGGLPVNAGSSRLTWLPSAVVPLQGSYSKTNGAVTMAWSKGQGPGNVVFSAPDSLTTTATFDTPGKYQLLLTVTNGNNVGRDELVVEVHTAGDNFGYSATDLQDFKDDTRQVRDYTDLAWSRIAPPPPPNVHPRILFNPDDLPDLRGRLTGGTISGPIIMNNLRNSAAKVTAVGATWRAAYDALAAGDAGLFQPLVDRKGMVGSLRDECFRALIDDDAAAGAKAGAALATLSEYISTIVPPYLSSPTTDWRVLQDQGIVYGDAIGWSYDFIYNYMSPSQRDSVRQMLALVTHGMWNIGMDVLPGFNANCSNWIPLTGQNLLVDALAIEGETGADPDLVLRYKAQYDRMLSSFVFSDGAIYEGMGKGWIGTQSFWALAKRGSMSLASPSVRNHIRQFYLHCMETTGYGWTWDEVIGGSSQGAKFDDVAVAKFVFPTDPIVDFTYRNACGPNYTSSGALTGGGILRAICAQDYDTSKTWDQAVAQQIVPNAALTSFFNNRGLLVTRSDWTANGTRLLFQPRSEPGGHSIPDRNTFCLSALGRIWAPYDIYGSGAGTLPGDASMAASVVRVDNVGSSTVPATVVDFKDTADFTYAVGDATDCYRKQFGGSTTPVDFSYNDKLLQKCPLKWADRPWGRLPNWYTAQNTVGYWQDTRPVQRALRTACLVRGGAAPPYSVIVDDIQMDNAAHSYKWRMMLANDLTSITVNGNDAIVTAPGSNTSLLVRVLGCSGSPTFVTDDNYQPYFNWPWLDVSIQAVAPDFKILLLPFVNGTTLPTTTWHGNTVYVSWPGGQVDHLLFAPNADGRTRVSFARPAADTTPPVLTLPANIVTTAVSPEGRAVTFTTSANDNVDGVVPVTCQPPSGSVFPIGTTTVRCSANDTSLNTTGGSFTVTVNPGSFALEKPVVGILAGDQSAALGWNPLPPAATYNIKRSTGGGAVETIASGVTTTSYVDTGLINGTVYSYMVAGVNGAGNGPDSDPVSVMPATVPAPWSAQDVGSAGLAGSTSVSATGAITMTGAGGRIGGNSEAFHFASQPWTGDGVLAVRLLSFQNASNYSSAGLMLRQSTASNSPNAFVGCQTFASQFLFSTRSTFGGGTTGTPITHSTLAHWFKLVRSGNTITAYQAENTSPGQQVWAQVGPATTIAMPATVLAGLQVASDSTSSLCTANFDHFGIYTPPTVTAPADITIAATSETGAIAYFSVFANGNMDGALTPQVAPPTGSFFPIGKTTVTASATDGIGQVAQASFTVTVTPLSSFASFQAQYFTPAQIADPSVSGPDADADGDGMTNEQEFISGTDPTDRASVLRIASLARGNGEVTIRFASVAGRTYRVEKSTSLAAGGWEPVIDLTGNHAQPDGSIAGDGATKQVIDTSASLLPSVFYRIIVTY